METQEWLDSHQSEEAEVYQVKLALQEIVSPLLSKLHQVVVICQAEGMPGMPGMNMEEMMRNMGVLLPAYHRVIFISIWKVD